MTSRNHSTSDSLAVRVMPGARRYRPGAGGRAGDAPRGERTAALHREPQPMTPRPSEHHAEAAATLPARLSTESGCRVQNRPRARLSDLPPGPSRVGLADPDDQRSAATYPAPASRHHESTPSRA